MALTEFLYVDETRLNSYIEQIGSPVTYDKVPTWTAELSLIGARAEAIQSRFSRDLSRYEKFERLLEHLQTNHLLYSERLGSMPDGYHPNQGQILDFVLETCMATKVVIPPDVAAQSRSLAVWVSPEPLYSESKAGFLCLLEDFSGPDVSSHDRAYSVSTYTIFYELVRCFHDDLFRSLTGDSGVERLGLYAPKYLSAFIKDPIGTLALLGGKPGPERKIRSLYRIRNFGYDNYNHDLITTFGYPIAIMAA